MTEHTKGPWYKIARIGERCTCCERELSGHAVRMLELDQRTSTYHDHGRVPDNESQGWFPFGLKCAKKEIAKYRAIISKAEGK